MNKKYIDKAISKAINEVRFSNLPADPYEENDFFDDEYPDPVITFRDFDDMKTQLANYFHYKKKHDRQGHFKDLSIHELVWDEEIAFVSGTLHGNRATIYFNPFFAELLLDKMEDELKQNPRHGKTNPEEPREYAYFKLFHGALLYAGYYALLTDQLGSAMTTDPIKNVQMTANRFKNTFKESIASFPEHRWELETIQDIMRGMWPEI